MINYAVFDVLNGADQLEAQERAELKELDSGVVCEEAVLYAIMLENSGYEDYLRQNAVQFAYYAKEYAESDDDFSRELKKNSALVEELLASVEEPWV